MSVKTAIDDVVVVEQVGRQATSVGTPQRDDSRYGECKVSKILPCTQALEELEQRHRRFLPWRADGRNTGSRRCQEGELGSDDDIGSREEWTKVDWSGFSDGAVDKTASERRVED